MVAFSDLTQVMQNARTDAGTLDEFLHNPADTKVTSRLGKQYWTLATLDNKLSLVKSRAETTLADMDTLSASANDAITAKINNANLSIDAKVASIDTRADAEIVKLQSAISTAAAAAAGQNGWTDTLVKLSNGRTQADKNAEFLSVKDFGAKGDGQTNDTKAINDALIQANLKSCQVRIPAGNYLYDGGGWLGNCVTIIGDGRNTTKIIANTNFPKDTYLLECRGYGSGIESVGFTANVAQTDGCFVKLTAPESYIADFRMDKFKLGINMLGNVSRIRHGRFQTPVNDGIGIFAGGGDNSQIIDDVLMGASEPLNIGFAGIRVRNSAALMITNTSVIGYGQGLLVDPDSDTDNVFCLYVNNCFFDNNKRNVALFPTNTGGVYRTTFTQCWMGSAHENDGMTVIGNVKGVIVSNSQLVLNKGAGLSINGGKAEDITLSNSIISANTHGIYCDAKVKNLKITSNMIGTSADFVANSRSAMIIDKCDMTDSIIANNIMQPNGVFGTPTIAPVFSNNIGYKNSWIDFTPVVTSQNGSLGNYAATGKYKIIDSEVLVKFDINIIDRGTATGDLRFTLPYKLSVGVSFGSGREVKQNGNMLNIFSQNNQCFIYGFDNQYMGNSGDQLVGNITYTYME